VDADLNNGEGAGDIEAGVPGALVAGVPGMLFEGEAPLGRPRPSGPSAFGAGMPLASATNDWTHSTVHCAIKSGL